MQDVKEADLKGILLGEMIFLTFLGRIVNRYPDEEDRDWFQSLIDEEVFSEAPFASEQEDTKKGLELMRKWCANGLNNGYLEELKVDYTSLFIGPANIFAPPWESIYTSDARLLFQESTLKVRQWYQKFGLESEKIHNEPDDNIGLELLFLAHLAKLGLEALNENDQEKLNNIIYSQRTFLSEHLLKWGPRFCDNVISNSKTDFYKGMGWLIRGSLNNLAEIFGENN
jgi:putative dimethyl sulfoxide reductase chaperone